MSGQVPEPVDIDRTKLFDKDTSREPIDLDLRSERCWFGAPGSRGNDNDRPRKERIRLYDDTEALSLLFVTLSLWKPQAKDVTPLHGVSP